jgi:thiol-disulfide isomerase/thioredoxin
MVLGYLCKVEGKDMKNNLKNIKSQEDFGKQLLMAGDKFTVVHFSSPSCGPCKALHTKVKEDKYVNSIILQLSTGEKNKRYA